MGWRTELADQVLARLSTLQVMGEPVAVERGQFDEQAPTISATDSRVRPYLVLWTTPGRRDETQEDLGATSAPLIWSFTVVAVGPDARTVDQLVDKVDPLLQFWRPTITGVSIDPIRSQWAGEPLAPSQNPVTTRFFAPLPYATTVGA